MDKFSKDTRKHIYKKPKISLFDLNSEILSIMVYRVGISTLGMSIFAELASMFSKFTSIPEA